MRKWIFVTLLTIPVLAYSLVDYSEDNVSYGASAPKRSTVSHKTKRKPVISHRKIGNSVGYVPSGMIKIKLDHSVQSINGVFGGKFNLTKIRTHIQTPYNIFLDASYWMGSYDNYAVVKTSAMQSGNVQAKLGFNWLRWGDATEIATIDFYLGSRFRGGESDISLSRNDKFVGIETAKRFLSFAMGFGYEYTVHGKPSSLQESVLSKTHKIATALSWQSTADIRFLVEADFFKVETPEKNYQFSSISPKLDLSLSPLVGLELGGIFGMKRVSIDHYFVNARLWDLPGAYGNSIFANLKIKL